MRCLWLSSKAPVLNCKPLGVSIVGGLLVSQFLTLYTTPVIYLYMDRLGAWARRWRKAAHLPGPVPEPAAGEAT